MDKKNFEKDINVPSKNIEYHNDAKDCELAKSGSCCWCKNFACYQLEEQLKNEKHSHEHTKVWIGEYIKKHPYRKDEYEQLKAELKSSKELRKYTYDCCKRAGEELAKNSFDWDGKEKNLVVQAIELNERFNQLKAENDNLKSLIWWIHVGAEGADKATTEYYENRNTPYEENYWKRIRALQPPTYESKYKLALTEIKEIAEKAREDLYTCESIIYADDDLREILQKISDLEV